MNWKIILLVVLVLQWMQFGMGASSGGEESEGFSIDSPSEKIGLVLIVVGLVIFSLLVETIKEKVEEKGDASLSNVVNALWGELAVAGLLSLLAFLMTYFQILHQVSNNTFHDPYFIDHEIHYMHIFLFIVFAIFIIQVVLLLVTNKVTSSMWKGWEHECRYTPEKVIDEYIKTRSYSSKEKLYFLLLRQEFLNPRDLNEPQLNPEFNFASYLSHFYSKKVAKVVQIHPLVWLSLLGVIFLVFLISFLPEFVHLIFFGIWNWFLFVLSIFIYRHLYNLRKKIVPYEIFRDLRKGDTDALEDLIVNDFRNLPYSPSFLKNKLKNTGCCISASSNPTNIHQQLFWCPENASGLLRNMCSSLLFGQAFGLAGFLSYYFTVIENLSDDLVIKVVLYAATLLPIIPLFIQINRILRELAYCTSVEMMKDEHIIKHLSHKARARQTVIILCILEGLTSYVRQTLENPTGKKSKKKKMKKLPADELSRIRDTFNLFDVDGDSRITTKEFRNFMRVLGYNMSKQEELIFIQELDDNNDGEIEFDEFLRFTQRRKEECCLAPNKKIHRMFKIFDPEGLGTIPVEDFVTIISDRLGSILSEEEIRFIVGEIDRDHDGDITLEEFSKTVKYYWKHGKF